MIFGNLRLCDLLIKTLDNALDDQINLENSIDNFKNIQNQDIRGKK